MAKYAVKIDEYGFKKRIIDVEARNKKHAMEVIQTFYTEEEFEKVLSVIIVLNNEV